MIRLCQGWGRFTNTFFSNHFSFFQSWRDTYLKIKLWSKLWKYLYLKLIVKRFQRLFRVQLDLDIFKVNSTNRDCIRKTMVGWQCEAQGGGENFNREGGEGGSHYVILLYWNFIVLGTVKDFIRYLFSIYFCCFKVQVKAS